MRKSSLLVSLAIAVFIGGQPLLSRAEFVTGANPYAAPAPAAKSEKMETFRGKVLETMDAGEYTYLRLKKGDTETWAAVPKATIQKGAEVGVANPMVMTGFESKTLHRKFDRILFGTLEGAGAGVTPVAAQETASQGMSATDSAAAAAYHGGNASAAKVTGPVKVPRAEGPDARTISEIFAQKDTLQGKNVLFRGKVVKVTLGVMGKNWLHLRDGSGSESRKDHDVTVTTKDVAKVGDTVVVNGKVGLNRDIGAGYSYPVLIEEASLKR